MLLVTLMTFVGISSAAQLPSRNYLPSNQGSQVTQLPFVPLSQSSIGSHTQRLNIGNSDEGNKRPQQEVEKNARVLKQDQKILENGDFHYSYETSNGIKAEEAGNPTGTQGGYAYKGDDGITYAVRFTAGKGGFRAEGAHLPVAPPTPDDILAALEQNAKDEAAGIFDDGQYHPDLYGAGPKDSKQSSSLPHQSFRKTSSPPSPTSASVSPSSSSVNRQGAFNSNTGYQY